MHAGHSTTRRGFLSAAALSALAVNGCGDGDRDSSSVATRSEGYPRRIRSALGTATIPSRPTRIVAAGQYRDEDAAVALGTTPVLSPDLSMFLGGGRAPWVAARLHGASPSLFKAADGLPFERIAAAEPDLILATDLPSIDADYAKLSAIAPTIAPATAYNKDRWQRTTMRVGAALDREDRARELIEDVEAQVHTARSDHPQFAGKTFTFGPVGADGAVTTINSETDASVIFLSELGLRLSKRVTGLPQSDLPGRATIAPERLDILDADVLVLTYFTAEAQRRLESQPLFRAIPAVREGRYVPLPITIAIALGFPSALSIPYGLRHVVPPLQRAIARL